MWRSDASIQAHFAFAAQPCEIDSLDMSLIFSGGACSQSSCQFTWGQGDPFPHTHRGTKGQTYRQTASAGGWLGWAAGG